MIHPIETGMKLLKAASSVFGPRPAYHETDLYRCIWILVGEQVDRKSLSRELRIGEGSTRSVLRQLVAAGLVENRKRGALLSGEGAKFAAELKAAVEAAGKIEKSDLTFQQTAFALRMRKCSHRIRSGVEQRDAAIRAGATGATVLCMREGKLVFPDSGYAVAEAQKNLFAEKLGGLGEGDAIILCYGENELFRERGAWSAALKLVK